MQGKQRQPDDETRHLEVHRRVRRHENDVDEDEGGDELGDERAEQAVAAEIALTPAVLAKAGRRKIMARELARGGSRRARPHPRLRRAVAAMISGEFAHREAAGGGHGRRHGRVDVAAGDRTDAIRHGGHG